MTDTDHYVWRTVEEWVELGRNDGYDEGYTDGHYVGSTDPDQWS